MKMMKNWEVVLSGEFIRLAVARECWASRIYIFEGKCTPAFAIVNCFTMPLKQGGESPSATILQSDLNY